MFLDGNKVYETEHLERMRNEVSLRIYGVAKARTAEKMSIIDSDTGEVLWDFSCDDPFTNTSMCVTGFLEAFEYTSTILPNNRIE